MKRFKPAAIVFAALAAIALVIPGAVMAAPAQHSRPAVHPAGTVFGVLESIDSKKAIIHTKGAHVKVALEPIVNYVTNDQAAALAGLQIGDQVEAFGRYFDGTLRAERIRYDTVPFVVSNVIRFDGRYVSSTPPTTTADGTLTIVLRRGIDITFNVDANTKYFARGHRLAGPPAYGANDHLLVAAQEYSDQSWLARAVNDLSIKP